MTALRQNALPAAKQLGKSKAHQIINQKGSQKTIMSTYCPGRMYFQKDGFLMLEYIKFNIPPKLKISLGLGCIDKWVKSKFDIVTPPELCSGPIQDL